MKTLAPAKLLRHRLLSFLTLLLVAAAANAQPGTQPIGFTLDPAATTIHWTLNSTLHTVHGTFKLKNGAFKLDPETGKLDGIIVIDATSGDSQNSGRDSNMHKNVIESAKFPEITFRPSHVEGKFDPAVTGTFKVDGILNIHGQDHPMQLSVDVHPHDSGVALTTKFSVPFVKWGMKDPSTFVFRVDKDVQLEVEGVAAMQ